MATTSNRSQFIRWAELEGMLPNLDRSTIWRWERRGIFPAHVTIGLRIVGWNRDEIEEWFAKRSRPQHKPTSQELRDVA